ncbi:PREDICTED: phospholipase A2 inhibitor and Ly6/PLAUR domain-containing protein-like [Nanorana parkeri]|uniref:phospholipase A2 inhibitor and Ly6/PLAUR domain-containing protein-like n=1 Tax=Nanorana parkeri TaxID=125878 RepID=UPI000854EDEC|nr:PREDICTED: phospholipase A2 inhibitor and Ly6/PLAUR domain-containing protein-like [Nanorana parkeri]
MNTGQGNKQVRVVTECCYKDNCNKDSIEVPPYNITRNSFICPVCYTYEAYDCKSEGYIACRGHEIECFDFAATILRQGWSSLKYAMMGCTTKGGCSIGQRIIPGTNITDVTRLSCRPAIPITH